MRRLPAVLLLLLAACGGPDRRDASRVRATPVATPIAAVTDAPSAAPTAGASATGRRPATARVTSAPAAGTTAAPAPSFAEAKITLTRVASLDGPLAMEPLGADLYIAEKGGRIRVMRGGSVDPSPVLDISSEVSTGGEQGLLDLAFSPDANFLYVHFTNTAGDTRIREYALAGGRVDTASARTVLSVDQPFANHNGGEIAFGRDGKLYIGLGDGGAANDPAGNGQSLGTLLGKLLRIEPRPSGGQPYGVPSDNPFVARSGARGEIWAYGVRNPWRFSFDRGSGDLWIGDVGQNQWEEVDRRAASSRGGENYGWDRMEGTHRFEGSEPADHVPPVYEYSHDEGCSITGGYVYRGARIPALQGAYVFADYCEGRLRGFVLRDGRATGHRFLGPKVDSLSSFGQDSAGELFVLSLDGGVYRIDPA